MSVYPENENKGKTIAYPLVKKVLKNKTGHSQGHLFLVTSKVYSFLRRLLYHLITGNTKSFTFFHQRIIKVVWKMITNLMNLWCHWQFYTWFIHQALPGCFEILGNLSMVWIKGSTTASSVHFSNVIKLLNELVNNLLMHICFYQFLVQYFKIFWCDKILALVSFDKRSPYKAFLVLCCPGKKSSFLTRLQIHSEIVLLL